MNTHSTFLTDASTRILDFMLQMHNTFMYGDGTEMWVLKINFVRGSRRDFKFCVRLPYVASVCQTGSFCTLQNTMFAPDLERFYNEIWVHFIYTRISYGTTAHS
jgi:hypothetical protein